MRTLRSAGHQTHRPSRSHLYQDSLPFLCRWMSCPCGQLADRRGNLIFLSGDGGEALSFNNRHRMEMGTPPRGRAATRADKTTGATSPAFGLRHADPAPPRRSEATRRRGSTQSPRPSSLSARSKAQRSRTKEVRTKELDLDQSFAPVTAAGHDGPWLADGAQRWRSDAWSALHCAAARGCNDGVSTGRGRRCTLAR
jgi:hypothetical protein